MGRGVRMRRFYMFLFMPLVGLAAWIGGPVSRADLGIPAETVSAAQCRAPALPDLRKAATSGPETGCDEPDGCENKEHISATFLSSTGRRNIISLPALSLHRMPPPAFASQASFEVVH